MALTSLTDFNGADGMVTSKAVLLGIVIALCTAYIAQKAWQWHRLRHIPGPFWAGISRGWMLRHTLAGNMNLELKSVVDKYGSLARVGPNDLVTCDPDILRRVWAVRSPYRRSEFYDAMKFNPTRDNLLSLRSDTAHNELRAKMAAGYSGKENYGLEQDIDSQVDSLIDLIERKYISSGSQLKEIDFARTAQFFTLDVITNVAFGRSFGYLKTDSDVFEYIKMTEDNMPFIMVASVFPVIARIMQTPLFRRLMPSHKDKIGFGKFMGVAKEVVTERFGSNKKVNKDMLGSFIAHGLTQEEAESETLLQIIAGSDTAATTIRATLLHIMSAPSVYAALQKEIDEAIEKGKISSPISDAEAKTLPYLQAVIKEGLRIFPPVTGLMSKTVPKGGDVLNGVFVPGGTGIGYSAWGVHHSKEIFGSDADQFRPERWLEAEGEKLKTMSSTVELVFSYGKWQCPGKSVAAIEFNKVFVELLRRYDLSLINPTNPWKSFCAGIFIQSDLFVRITRRQ